MILPRIKHFTNQNQDNSNLDHLKVLGKVAGGLGVAGAAGLAVGAKKLYDRNKQAQQ